MSAKLETARRGESAARRWARLTARALGLAGAANAVHDRIERLLRPRRRVPFFRAFLRPGDLCFDIGANRGDYTEFFLSLGARVVAVEPLPACLALLRARFGERFGVTIVAAGLAEAEGERTMRFSAEATDVSSMSEEWVGAVRSSGRLPAERYRWDSECRVAVTTLDTLIARHGMPAFCKVDVEGMEYEVLRGLSRPVPALSLEFTPERPGPTSHCIRRLCELGDYEFNYSPGVSTKWIANRWMTANEAMAFLGGLPLTTSGDLYARLRPH